ncbi:MAG: hypothetical protein M1826_003429 [Phylliscum demangeonii]|nr:MAG: hypothetical protein M1826_003429 [Phylliscum demangeonii]
MFYSHESPKSALKKVNRKAILNVNIPRACETIVAPDAPMALRLQGNLLYGVARVYSQQCGYVLADAQLTQSHMKTRYKAASLSDLDPQAGKAPPDQLMLPDDPAFLPDLMLPGLDATFSLLELSSPLGSLLTSQQDQEAAGTAEHEVVSPPSPGLIIPTSPADDIPLPVSGLRGAPAAVEDYAGRIEADEEGFLPDVDFEFDEPVQPVEPVDVDQPVPTTDEAPAPRPRVPRPLPMDTRIELRPNELSLWNANYAGTMLSMARSRLNHQLPRLAKKNATFWVFGSGIGNIGAGVGQSSVHGPLDDAFAGPNLMMIFSTVTPTVTPTPAAEGAGKRKTPSDEPATPESERRRVRARVEQEAQIGRGAGDHIVGGASLGDDDLIASLEQDVEMGRDAAAELQDLSSAMPWNVTASLRGSRQGSAVSRGRGLLSAAHSVGSGAPASLYGGSGVVEGSLPSRRLSRMTAASPLGGRGRPGGADLGSGLDIPADDDDDDEAFLGGHLSLSADADADADAEFQLPEPAPVAEPGATGADHPAVGEPPDHESLNFLEYVKAGIEEEAAAAAATDTARPSSATDFIMFERLLPPSAPPNSNLVAAQAFYHTLVLATRNLVVVEQAVPFGDIKITPVVGGGGVGV